MNAVGEISLSSDQDLQHILSLINADIWVKRLVTSRAYGFHHSVAHFEDSLDDGVEGITTYFLGTCVAWCVWVTTQKRNSKFATTKGLIFSQPTKKPLLNTGKPISLKFLDCLEFFRGEFGSSLSLPFVLAVYTFSWIEDDLVNSLDRVRDVIKLTGHGDSVHEPDLEMSMDSQNPMATARKMGATHDIIINASKHVDIVIPLLDYLVRQGATVPKERTSLSILSAVELLRRQVESAGKQCQYLGNRSRNQSEVLFAYLTHEDSASNMKIADASRALAEAASRDTSSMKTVAVWTMAFLPATFLAALFSIPSMGWVEPEKFWVCWACVIPTTIVTFTLWAGITQRRQITKLMRSVREKDPEKGGNIYGHLPSPTR
ncbi:hypothetical protein QBC41DRAFT_234273 [Cercophora samala]|uniref:Uncharacterized protein n=1 Tax=Cercophora samala TaxID=330535 RepID=A0AA40D5I7_9PEZI|nr:hypothetical protein QBC41DRAFT_234273 [Cercophora samala]